MHSWKYLTSEMKKKKEIKIEFYQPINQHFNLIQLLVWFSYFIWKIKILSISLTFKLCLESTDKFLLVLSK